MYKNIFKKNGVSQYYDAIYHSIIRIVQKALASTVMNTPQIAEFSPGLSAALAQFIGNSVLAMAAPPPGYLEE
jgi:hypothetical protein